MNINDDYSKRAVINHHELPWIASPESGVDRRMLECHGGEVAKATSIVRYQAGSKFPIHTHDLGEEILVLEGVFSDETGHYPAGSYMMNPPGSAHAPYSETGCTLFVKLRHLGPDQVQREVIDTSSATWYQGMVPGLTVMPGGFSPMYAKTAQMDKGTPIPVVITAYGDRSFTFEMRQPPVTFFLKKATGLKSGAKLTGRETVGSITRAQLREIAEKKMKDLNAIDLDGAMKQVEGTARNMGITVEA